jgi:hypothetical protein
MVRRMIRVAVVIAVLSHSALAAEHEAHHWSDAGWGVLSVLSNIFYMPVKIVYAGVGTVTGSLAYVLTVGDSDTAQKVWGPSLGGTYVITPEMLRGNEPILFNGQSYSND